jgi:hypothetical protein
LMVLFTYACPGVTPSCEVGQTYEVGFTVL